MYRRNQTSTKPNIDETKHRYNHPKGGQQMTERFNLLESVKMEAYAKLLSTNDNRERRGYVRLISKLIAMQRKEV